VKTFYSAQEIEDLARQGVRELLVDDSVVLTDLARQTAGQLGLRLVTARGPEAARSTAPVQAPGQAPVRPAANGAAHLAPVVAAAAPLPAKPRGCQHGAAPAVANGQAALGTPAGNGSAGGRVVDDLVGLVKQMSKR
jgi:hypothetical protein